MQIRQLLEKTGSVATEQRSLALNQLYRLGEEYDPRDFVY
jgi:hypothetical protein